MTIFPNLFLSHAFVLTQTFAFWYAKKMLPDVANNKFPSPGDQCDQILLKSIILEKYGHFCTLSSAPSFSSSSSTTTTTFFCSLPSAPSFSRSLARQFNDIGALEYFLLYFLIWRSNLMILARYFSFFNLARQFNDIGELIFFYLFLF